MEAEARGYLFAGITDNRFLQPVQITRVEILESQLRQYHFFRLIFPHNLTNDTFSPAARNGKVIPNVVPVLSMWEEEAPNPNGRGGTITVPVQSVRSDVEWKIAIDEKKKKSTVAPKPETNEMNDLMLSFYASMSIRAEPRDDDDEVVDEED